MNDKIRGGYYEIIRGGYYENAVRALSATWRGRSSPGRFQMPGVFRAESIRLVLSEEPVQAPAPHQDDLTFEDMLRIAGRDPTSRNF